MLFNRLVNWCLKFSERNQKVHQFILRLSVSQIFRRILYGSFWNAVLNLWGKGISFVGTVIIVRMIGREAFGEFGMLSTTIAMFGMFTTFSISQTATKYIAQYRTVDKEKAGRIIGLTFIFSAVLGILMLLCVMIFADVMAVKALNAPHLKNSLQLMGLGLLFSAVNGAQNGIIAGFEGFKANALVGVISNLGLTVLKVFLTYLYGFKGAIVGITIEPVLTYLITYFLTRNLIRSNDVKIRFKDAFKESGILLHYSLPSLLTGLLVFPANWYSMTLLAKSEGGYHELGAYNAANQWFNVLIFLPYILSSTFLPVFSDMIARNQLKEIDRIIKIAIFIVSVVFVFLNAVFLLFGDQISLIYGNDFKGIGFLLNLVVFSLLPQALSIILSNLLAALNRMWLGFAINLLWCIILLGSANLFLPFGAEGLVSARILAFTVNFIIMLIFYLNWKSKMQLSTL
jgi:O-antigen/teichoic acid export membrane protein